MLIDPGKLIDPAKWQRFFPLRKRPKGNGRI